VIILNPEHSQFEASRTENTRTVSQRVHDLHGARSSYRRTVRLFPEISYTRDEWPEGYAADKESYAFITGSNERGFPVGYYVVSLPDEIAKILCREGQLNGYAILPYACLGPRAEDEPQRLAQETLERKCLAEGVAAALFFKVLTLIEDNLMGPCSIDKLVAIGKDVRMALGAAQGTREFVDAIKLAGKIGHKAHQSVKTEDDLSVKDKTANRRYLMIAYETLDAAAARSRGPYFERMTERLSIIIDLMCLEKTAQKLGETTIADYSAMAVNDHAPVMTSVWKWPNLITASTDIALKLKQEEQNKPEQIPGLVDVALEVSVAAFKIGNFEAACSLIETAAVHASEAQLDIVVRVAQAIRRETEGMNGLETADRAMKLLKTYDPDSLKKTSTVAPLEPLPPCGMTVFEKGRPPQSRTWLALI
jgi:hypothetical protein